MKRLFIPFIALALCPPAQAESFGLYDLPTLPSASKTYEYEEPNNPLIKHIEGRRKHEAELKQKQVLAQCKARKEQWKQFGAFEYNWAGWKQTKGTWVTKRIRNFGIVWDGCRESKLAILPGALPRPPKTGIFHQQVAVTCKGLQMSVTDKPEAYYTASGGIATRYLWGPWRLPEAGGETEMVAALCTGKKG